MTKKTDLNNLILPRISGTLNKCEKEDNNDFSRFVEDFIGRSKKLENDFFRS